MPDDADAVLDRLGIDGRLIGAWRYLGETPVGQHGQPLSPWGTETGDDYGTMHRSPLADVASVTEVERYPCWPDAAWYDYAEAASAAHHAVQRYATRGPYWKPLFCQVSELMGMEEAMVRMQVEPEIFEAVLDQVFQHVPIIFPAVSSTPAATRWISTRSVTTSPASAGC